jgi:glycine cleavage system H lipoate-binding protein
MGGFAVQEGQELEEFQKMCEVQSDKASVEITSRYSGTVAKLHATVGDIVQVHVPSKGSVGTQYKMLWKVQMVHSTKCCGRFRWYTVKNVVCTSIQGRE